MGEEIQEFFASPVEKVLLHFEDKRLQINPKNSNWIKRVKVEINNIQRYLEFLRNEKNALWFDLAPDKRKEFNYKVWKGTFKVPSRPEITFGMRVILPNEYPKAMPRAFIEDSVTKYSSKHLYLNSRWDKNVDKKETKSFVMICHDHMKEFESWTPDLSISHFLLRQILYWWNAKLNIIVSRWDELN